MTVADPDFVVSCVEVALTPTCVVAATTGAVNNPVLVTVPAVADQVTVVLKFAVPVTVAVHWLFCPDKTVVGEQVTCTCVMLEVEPPLLPQAAINAMLPNTSNSPAILTVIVS